MSNLTAKDLYGCMTALATPMHEDGQVDYIQWQKLVQSQIDAEINGIVV
ncbi:MAG: dihydrodipicolinate synthase family protein, partial [Xanthomonadales bacterium]|nr:dihydrodipicolinate synthase family protein [Xanthomonadales bacterium]